MHNAVEEILLQKPLPDVNPFHLLLAGLHLLLHPHPPVLCLCHQQEGGKGEFLSLRALYHLEDFLTFTQPRACLIRGGFASKLRRLVAHEVLHRHRPNRGNHRPRLSCNKLHRVHHPMDCVRNLICPNIVSTSPISHCLCTPHNSAVHINQLRL